MKRPSTYRARFARDRINLSSHSSRTLPANEQAFEAVPRRPMRREPRIAIDKRTLIIDGIFKPLEGQGFRPSFRMVARILRDVLGVTIGDHELLRILDPWLKAAAQPGPQGGPATVPVLKRNELTNSATV